MGDWHDVGIPANRRRLGILALGTLLGGAPVSATAAERESVAPAWAGTLSPAATTTATSSLALGRPAQTFTVTTADDVVDPGDGKLSLREAVAKANATAALDAIEFKSSLEGQTLVLTGGELVISEDLTIDGDRDRSGSNVTLDGNQNGGVLVISAGRTEVSLMDLGITNGSNSGIFLGQGTGLTLNGCTIGYNRGYAGGGIWAAGGGRVTVLNSVIIGNYAGFGGGIEGGGEGGELVVRNSAFYANSAREDGGAISWARGSLVMEHSVVRYNAGGALYFGYTAATISGSSISDNFYRAGGGEAGGIWIRSGSLMLVESTVSGNQQGIGGISSSGAELVLRNSTVTGNVGSATPYFGGIGGIRADGRLDVSNSIVAGNFASAGGPASDISGGIALSNGHNVFGTNVAGSIAGDRESVPAGAVFAAIDPATGGGQADARGVVPLRRSLANPASSGGDPLAAGATGQLGSNRRPDPIGSLPDIGAIESSQRPSTSPTLDNDVITGNAAANSLSGLAGNDLIKGLGGNDHLNGGDGSDVLDGGPGNNLLNGGTGVDLASFAFSPVAVVVDLSATPATARRGGETDTLTGIEGAIGTAKADTFIGDAANNEFQGGHGKDTATGGGGRDLYDFNTVADSPAGAQRDVIGDFVPGQDVIDLAGIDADSTIPGDQSFRWVGTATLTGAAQLGYQVVGGNTIVRASTDADAAAELEIQLTGKKTLTAADFVP